MPLFAELSEERMQWLCANITDLTLAAGEVLVTEGEPPKGFFVLLEGEFLVLRKSEGQDMPVGRHAPLAFFGEAPLLAGIPVPVTLRATRQSRLIRLHDEAFRELLACCPTFSQIVFQAMASRAAGLESFIRQREKMAALGTLAAGLAHELNNPAAAVARAADRMRSTMEELYARICALSKSGISPQAMAALDALRRSARRPETLAALQLSEYEDALADWLDAHDIEKGWLLAAALASAGIRVKQLEILASQVQGPALTAGLGWLAATLELASLLDESERGVQRMAAIVKAIKSYSYMDQAPLQEVDIHDGLEDTLTIMRHKLKQGVIVTRDYDRSLPRVPVYGAELNQVWTNLIDNAADAIECKGNIAIRTWRENDHAIVEIADDGPGISSEIQPRIFEPFFTTKPVGQGTGLGLDIVQKIVNTRHGGSIQVNSQPGDTRFRVRLPLTANSN